MSATSKWWERRHEKGYMAVVSIGSDGLYTANALNLVNDNPQWANQHITDLSTAQAMADRRVPKHDCKCAGWQMYKHTTTA